MNGAGVAGPAGLDRQQVEVDVVAGEHDLLARARCGRTSAASRRSTSASGARGPSRRAPAAAASRARRRASAATSSSRSTPKARHMRRSVPNWLISSGCSEPFGCSKRSAGPPALTVRSTISVISRCGSTSAATRTSSPSRSSSAIQSRRSRSRSCYRREASLRARARDRRPDDRRRAARATVSSTPRMRTPRCKLSDTRRQLRSALADAPRPRARAVRSPGRSTRRSERRTTSRCSTISRAVGRAGGLRRPRLGTDARRPAGRRPPAGSHGLEAERSCTSRARARVTGTSDLDPGTTA